jgi:hypothetical protein
MVKASNTSEGNDTLHGTCPIEIGGHINNTKVGKEYVS